MYPNSYELTSIAQYFLSEAPQEFFFCTSLSTWRQMKDQFGQALFSERSQSKEPQSSWQKTYMES